MDSFEQAQQEVKTLTKKPGNEVLLKLYALYKQGSEGNARGERPGGFDFVGGAKYDAWAALQGHTQQEARQAYIELVTRLKAQEQAL